MGYFSEESHKQWVDDNPSKGAKRAGYSSSLWHHYDKGTQCDRTGLPREVDVKLTCTMSAGGSSTAVSMYLLEPKTCQYILVVESPIVCALVSLADDYGLVDDSKLQESIQKAIFEQQEQQQNTKAATGSVSEAIINAEDVQV